MLTEESKQRISEYLGLALGFFLSARVSSESSEYDLRNAYSRIYYAFFHVSLAFLLSQAEDIDKYRHDHGLVHGVIGRKFGKYLGRFVRESYKSRLEADYEPAMFARHYADDLERARADAVLLLERARKNFYWIYHESRKVL